MNTPIDIRFAKNITIAQAARSGWGRRGRRLALALPLAAVAAAGLVACDGPQAGQAGAAPSVRAALAPVVPVPAVPVTAPSEPADAPATGAPSAAAPATGAPSSDAPATATAPTRAAVRPSTSPGTGAATDRPAAPAHGKGIEIRFDGLAAGRRVEAGGDRVPFSVTWTNATGRRVEGIAPVVASRFFDGARCAIFAPMASGGLERRDGDHWTALDLSQGTGMDYAQQGDAAAFSLAPGASRTIEYRMGLTADNGPGTLRIEADAYLRPDRGTFDKIGEALTGVQVVDPHRPAAALLAGPGTELRAGGPAVELTTRITNPTGAAFGSAQPELLLLTGSGSGQVDGAYLAPEAVRVEVFQEGTWRQIATESGCSGARDGLRVDTDRLRQRLGAGAGAETRFRISLAPSAAGAVTSLTVAVGAQADGHHAELSTRQLAVRG
ncbi:hypothetical protein AB0K43_21240 [Kitasatospora sp. NPDC049258]|uniref:hypothetical protein n=1 Tax=Kitasatospora sp. NPDC049258 TaxID=3155394 RepID=UPI00342ACBE0